MPIVIGVAHAVQPRRGCAKGVEVQAMVSDYRYSVHFEDGPRVTTNYMGDVLQVGDVFTFEGRSWVVTDAKALGEREVDFEIHVRRAEEE
jgi:hypothetical protein